MSFASPLFLLTLLVIPLALLVYSFARKRRRRYAVRFPGVSTLAAIAPRASQWRRRVPLALFLAALAALSVASARPNREVEVPREQATIVLVTDVSRSMLADDVTPSRLDAARNAARRFVDELPQGIKVGVVAFAEAPHTIDAADRRPRRRCARRSTRSPPTAAPPPATASPPVWRWSTARARTRRPPRSCCSPTARRRPAATRSGSHARPRSSASRSTPSRSAARAL